MKSFAIQIMALTAAALGVVACSSSDPGSPSDPGSGGAGGTHAGTGGAGASSTSGSGGSAGTGGGGGNGSNPELDRACTPGFELDVTDTDPQRAQVFFDALGQDPEPVIQEIGRGVCHILYREPAEVRNATHLKLIIEYDPNGVAWKAGDGADIEVGISTAHLNNIKNEGRDVAYEIKGILYHEMTHMYQHDDSDRDGVPLGIIEGIADFVRLHSGYPATHWSKDPGGAWDDGYTKTAYFLDWIEGTHPDFVHRLNLSMDERDNVQWTEQEFQNITGQNVDQLWSEYQSSF